MQSIGTCDMNPMNSSRLSSSDTVSSLKMLILKVVFVIIATMLDQMANIQAGIMAAAMFGVCYYLYDGVSAQDLLEGKPQQSRIPLHCGLLAGRYATLCGGCACLTCNDICPHPKDARARLFALCAAATLQVPFYNKYVNIIWAGLWLGVLDVTVILLVMQLTWAQVTDQYTYETDPRTYADSMTKVMRNTCHGMPNSEATECQSFVLFASGS